jgi:DNA-binding GntR family transcriptional regulator
MAVNHSSRSSLAGPRDPSLELPANPLRIVPQPVRRQVEEQLRRLIMDGTFAPGEHLPDRVLCEQLGVSRSIVREAVRLLEAEGLVKLVPHRGPFVAFLTASEAAQVYEVRGALEALAGAGFATRASDEERAELRRIYGRLAASGAGTGRHVLLDLKQQFYDVLLRGCGNDYVSRMLGQLLNCNTQLRATSLSAPDRLPATVREIGQIIAAIDRRDPDGARQACLDHVRAAAEVALRILRDKEDAALRKMGGAAQATES